jgi:hypothetical protein
MNRFTIFLAATFAAIAVAGVYLGNQLRLQKGQNEKYEARVAALEASREAAELPAAAPVEASLDAAGTKGAAPAFSEAPVPGHASPPTQSAKPSLEQSIQRALQSPEGQDFARLMQRSALEQRYPDMAKALNLTAEQVDQVLDFLAGREVEMSTLESRLERTRDRAAREELMRVIRDKERVYAAELSSLLGNSYPEWQAYDLASRDRLRETYTRQGEIRMRAAIVAGGSPLNDAQFQSLTVALRAEESRFNQEVPGQSMQQQLQGLPELARRQAEVAAVFLDADQLARLRQHLDQMYGSVGAVMDFGTLMGLLDEDE